MFMKYFIALVTLWSWNIAYGIPHSPWAFVEASGKEKCGVVEIGNMPRVRSQDSIPICGSMCTATLAQYQICKNNSGLYPDCSKIPRNQEVSPFAALAWMHTNTGSGVHELQNHSNLTIYGKDLEGGASDGLENASGEFVFATDSCFPFDQFANDHGLNAFPKLEEIFNQIDQEYIKYADKKEREKTEGDICENCEVAKAVARLNIPVSLDEIKSSLEASKKAGKDSKQAMYDLTIGNCKEAVTLDQSPKFDKFPKGYANAVKKKDKNTLKQFTYDALIGKVKNVLEGRPGNPGNPLAFDGVCLEYVGKECKKGSGHSVIISGYRRVCKNNSKCVAECRDVVKVQNSWGKDWQIKNDDGWVDAETLFSYVTADPARMENVLSWYQ
jgi:hypothetical protein